MLGRVTADAVPTLGAGVDGAVRRIEVGYDTGGRPYLYTSYDAASTGSVVNQVQRGYNGLGQLTTEYQSTAGAVNTLSTPKVQYAYSEMAGGANHSRLVSMTYPNGRVLNDNYASGLDDRISRLSSLSDSSATLESYSYLGLDTVVRRSHPQPGVDLTYVTPGGSGDGGDQYTGLDRFGRVADQKWYNNATATATDEFTYGYDRDSNRLYRDNLVNASFGELYHANGAGNGYDGLNQLTAFSRGALNASKDSVASPSHSQSWSLDAAGNWASFTSDASTQTRTANRQNEVTSISGQSTPGYDGNGNTTTDQAGNSLVYDAWNRLVAYKSGGTTLAAYGYDALGRRVTQAEGGTTTDLYYSAQWQVLEERVGGTAKAQYVWSPVYVDALVERDRDADGNPANGLEERLYAQQDANFNVTALLDTTGNVVERYAYDPYGSVSVLTAAWGTRAGSAYAWSYLFEGGRYDSTTGLYNFRNRDLSPALGRWVEVDPLGFESGDPNFYRALGNRPTNTTDPSGLEEKVKLVKLNEWKITLGKIVIDLSRGKKVDITGLITKKITVEAQVTVCNPKTNRKIHNVFLSTYSAYEVLGAEGFLIDGRIVDGDSSQANSVKLSPGDQDTIEVEKDYRLSGRYSHIFVLRVFDRIGDPVNPDVLKREVVGEVKKKK